MTKWTYRAADEAATAKLGLALADVLSAGSVVALNGPLGAGKTRLVQSLAAGLGADRQDVVSPTFVVIHEYPTKTPIYHFDVYRIQDDDEFLELGPDEYFESDGITLIEWAERVENCLPSERMDIVIQIENATERSFELSAHGSSYESILTALSARLGGSMS